MKILSEFLLSNFIAPIIKAGHFFVTLDTLRPFSAVIHFHSKRPFFQNLILLTNQHKIYFSIILCFHPRQKASKFVIFTPTTSWCPLGIFYMGLNDRLFSWLSVLQQCCPPKVNVKKYFNLNGVDVLVGIPVCGVYVDIEKLWFVCVCTDSQTSNTQICM